MLIFDNQEFNFNTIQDAHFKTFHFEKLSRGTSFWAKVVSLSSPPALKNLTWKGEVIAHFKGSSSALILVFHFLKFSF